MGGEKLARETQSPQEGPGGVRLAVGDSAVSADGRAPAELPGGAESAGRWAATAKGVVVATTPAGEATAAEVGSADGGVAADGGGVVGARLGDAVAPGIAAGESGGRRLERSAAAAPGDGGTGGVRVGLRRREVGGGEGEVEEVAADLVEGKALGAAGGEPVGGVAFEGEVGEVEAAKVGGVEAESGQDGFGVAVAGIVVVGDDDDAGAAQSGGIGGAPLAGAAGLGGGGEAEGGEGVGVLLAFDEVEELVAGDGGAESRQAVEDSFNSLEVPDPTAGGCGAPAGEGFGFEAENLVEEVAGGVGVGVGGGDVAARGARGGSGGGRGAAGDGCGDGGGDGDNGGDCGGGGDAGGEGGAGRVEAEAAGEVAPTASLLANVAVPGGLGRGPAGGGAGVGVGGAEEADLAAFAAAAATAEVALEGGDVGGDAGLDHGGDGDGDGGGENGDGGGDGSDGWGGGESGEGGEVGGGQRGAPVGVAPAAAVGRGRRRRRNRKAAAARVTVRARRPQVVSVGMGWTRGGGAVPTGVVVGSRASGVLGSLLTVGGTLAAARVAWVERRRRAGGRGPTVASKRMVQEAPGARVGSWTAGAVAPRALPAVTEPAVVETVPVSRRRWGSRGMRITTERAAVGEGLVTVRV